MANFITSRKENKLSVFHLALKEDAPIYVHDYGYHETEPAHSFGPAVRPYYLIHFIKSGEGTFINNNKAVKLKGGDAFIIRPGEVTTYYADTKNPWVYYWISFNGSYAQKLMESTTDKDIATFKKQGLVALMDAIDTTVSDEIGTLALLLTVLNSLKTETIKVKDDFIQEAINYIENNYFKEFNASSLADDLKVSRAYFTTTFTKRTGETPYNYLLKIRIEKAKEYLTKSNLSVTEIAYSVGFSSLERFSELFKLKVGVSPSEFKKQNL